MKNGVYIGLRVPQELDLRVKAIQESLSGGLAGVEVKKSELLRNLLEKGLDDFEAQLGPKNG